MDQKTFAKMMFRLRACYHQRVSDQDHFKANVMRYYEGLSKRSDEVLVEAFETAWHAFPSWFPTLGELDGHCNKIAQRKRDATLKLPEGDPWNDGEGRAKAREYMQKLGLAS